MTHLLEDLRAFLEEAPTSWHAAHEVGNRLASCDYTPLDFSEKWKLEPGGKYFVIREGAIAAFSLPKKKPQKMAIIATHTDSPALKLKPNPEIRKKNMLQLGVEVYGGVVLPSWVNRDLAIAGRVVVERKNGAIEEELVYFDEAPVIIPLLAPHLNRDLLNKGLELHKQDHLAPVATLIDEEVDTPYLETLIRRYTSFHKLIDFDLMLVPLDPPRYLGGESEMLASYRLDNLGSAHAALVALGHLKKPAEHTLAMGLFWDHEEVGSSTHVGAGSPFFSDLYQRITAHYKMTAEEEILLRSRSLCLSVDMTHALNPNYENKYDPNHSALLGKGVVLKYNANMRYTTSASSGAQIATLCNALDLKFQRFVNRSDNPAGSTVGPIFTTLQGIETADIGLAQLSMHAAREIIACKDHLDMCTLLTGFLQGGQ